MLSFILISVLHYIIRVIQYGKVEPPLPLIQLLLYHPIYMLFLQLPKPNNQVNSDFVKNHCSFHFCCWLLLFLLLLLLSFLLLDVAVLLSIPETHLQSVVKIRSVMGDIIWLLSLLQFLQLQQLLLGAVHKLRHIFLDHFRPLAPIVDPVNLFFKFKLKSVQ